MFRLIINTEYKTITAAALMLSGATLISRVVGIIRDRVLAHYYGAGSLMDAYLASFKIPDLIYNLLIVGALTAGFIPTFTKLFQSEDKSPAWRLANNLINIAGVLLITLCGLGIIFSPVLSKVIAPGFTPDNLEKVAMFTRVMFLSPLIFGISMIAGGMLQSLRRFTLYSIAPILYNFGIIVGAVGFVPIFGDIGLPMGVVLGALLHCVLQIYGAYEAGWRWKWYFKFNDFETKMVGKLMVPRTLGLAASQFSQIAFTMIASLLPMGSIAVYSYANNLQAVPTGIIGIPFAIAVFPLLSAATAKNDMVQFAAHISSTARKIIFLILPLSIIFLLLRAQIVRVVLGSGEFDWNATINTANTLAFFALGLLAQSLIPLLARAFYALSNTKTPFVIGIISELFGIIAALLFYKKMGPPGLALAVTIAATLNVSMLIVALKIRTENFDVNKILPLLYKVTASALIMALVVQLMKYPLAKIFNQQYFWGIFGQGVVAASCGIAVYVVLCYILRVPELMELMGALQKRLLKTKNIPTQEGLELRN